MLKNAQKLWLRLVEGFHELPGLAIALAVFVWFSARMGFDTSVLHSLPYAAVNLIFAEFLAYWGVRLAYPYLYRAHRHLMEMPKDAFVQLRDDQNQYLRKCATRFAQLHCLFFGLAVLLLLMLRY